MPHRLAAIMAILAFAACLLIGALQAGNTFATTVVRALLAMGATFLVALLMGFMGQKMLDENLNHEEKKLKNSPAKESPNDR